MAAALLVGLPGAILYNLFLDHFIAWPHRDRRELTPNALGYAASRSPREPWSRDPEPTSSSVGFAVLMLVGVSIILFTIMRLAPGGPEAVLIGGEFSQEAAAQIRQRLGARSSARAAVSRLGRRRPARRPRPLVQDG